MIVSSRAAWVGRIILCRRFDRSGILNYRPAIILPPQVVLNRNFSFFHLRLAVWVLVGKQLPEMGKEFGVKSRLLQHINNRILQ
jgi:hypothetical protein